VPTTHSTRHVGRGTALMSVVKHCGPNSTASGYGNDRASERARPGDVGDQVLMRGLGIVRSGLPQLGVVAKVALMVPPR
jgi:hypothetical protein